MDILFINPPSAFGSYEDTKVKVFKQVFPLLSFMSLSAFVKRENFTTDVLDLGIENNPYLILAEKLRAAKPKFIGLTSTTPLFPEVVEIVKISREVLGDSVQIIYGGPHATALPEESLKECGADFVVTGEGEITLLEIMQGKHARGVVRGKMIEDLDLLPYLIL